MQEQFKQYYLKKMESTQSYAECKEYAKAAGVEPPDLMSWLDRQVIHNHPYEG